MIQVFRHENKPISVFCQKVRRKNMDFFLKEPMLVKKRKEGEEVYNQRMGSAKNTSKDCDLLMTLFVLYVWYIQSVQFYMRQVSNAY